MTKQEYADYEAAVAEFFSHGLCNLSSEGEPFFSWSSCQCCGTRLGGDRYECNGYNEQTKEVEEYNRICSDCVYYAEYGRLDDSTMMDMEE
jgi:hypothetical protein